MRDFYCPCCGKPAEVVQVTNVKPDDPKQDIKPWIRVDLECHNDPGCPIIEARIEIPEEELR